jgi:hypothetical protein
MIHSPDDRLQTLVRRCFDRAGCGEHAMQRDFIGCNIQGAFDNRILCGKGTRQLWLKERRRANVLSKQLNLSNGFEGKAFDHRAGL